MPFDSSYLIFGIAILSFTLLQVNTRRASPVLAIVNRWLRWVTFATGSALMVDYYNWVDRPFWVLAIAFFLLWFLVETIYTWLAIHALSVSPIPLFPKFSVNSSGDEWPTHPRFLKVRDQLRSAGFKNVQALRAEVAPGMYLRLSVYQDKEAKTRAQVTFLPQGNGAIAMCLSFTSQTISGYRYVTDNLYLPFGGFYPESWLVDRSPWSRSWKNLLKRHEARLNSAQEAMVPWDSDPLTEVNAQQRELDQINTEMGFLLPHGQREDMGKMSHEGRYRVWKEVWLLNYFGRSARYV